MEFDSAVEYYENQLSGLGVRYRHIAGKHRAYFFTTPEQLVADFERDIARWNHENRDS